MEKVVKTNYFILVTFLLAVDVSPFMFISTYHIDTSTIIFLIISNYLLLSTIVKFSVETDYLIVKFPFRFWKREHKFKIQYLNDLEYGGGKLEYLTLYFEKAGNEKKITFEFYTFRFKAMRQLVKFLQNEIEKRHQKTHQPHHGPQL